jgi:predicted metal-binding transcription factor (methanogenesis marker protein 9)
MTTKAELIAQCKAENPKMVATILGEEIELSAEEYEKAANDWADMRLIQIADENAKAQAEADKVALLVKLGITADEFKTLLGDNK